MSTISASPRRVSLGPCYWRLLSSASLANLGDGIRVTAFPLLALSLTANPTAVAGLAAMEFLPWILFGPVAGALVDRLHHQRLMVTVNAGRAVAVGAVAVAVLTDTVTLPMLYVVGFIVGIGECLYDTATQAVVPTLVSDAALPRANSLLSTAWITFDEFVGPFVGARLFEVARSLPYLVHAGALGLASLCLVSRRPTGAPPQPTRPTSAPMPHLGRMIADGVRVVARDRVLRPVILAMATVAAADSAWFAVFVIFVTRDLGASPATFGVLLAVGSVGGIVGGVTMERLGVRISPAAAIAAATAGVAVSQVGLALASDVVVVGALLVLNSMALAVWNIAAVTVRQRLAPADTVGRVMSLSRTVIAVASTLAAVTGGLIAQFLSVRAAFLIGLPFVLVFSAWAVIRLRSSSGQSTMDS